MRSARGVATIYQDLALASRLPIWQNVFVGAELTRPLLPGVRILDKRAMREASSRYLARLKVDIRDTDRAIERLSGGQRQAVAIARALHWNARLVIMDEPTAALGVAESRQVLDLIRELHRGGTTVILISHNMAEVVDVATRVVVFKGGRKIADRPATGSPRTTSPTSSWSARFRARRPEDCACREPESSSTPIRARTTPSRSCWRSRSGSSSTSSASRRSPAMCRCR